MAREATCRDDDLTDLGSGRPTTGEAAMGDRKSSVNPFLFATLLLGLIGPSSLAQSPYKYDPARPWPSFGPGFPVPPQYHGFGEGGFMRPPESYVPGHVFDALMKAGRNEAPRSSAPAPPVVAPNPNVLTRVQVKPNSNPNTEAMSRLKRFNEEDMDALQAVEADRAGDKLNFAITSSVSAFGNAALQREWTQVVLQGSGPESLEQFRQKWGPGLPPVANDRLAVRGEFAAYQSRLRAGTLTEADKDQDLAKLAHEVQAKLGGTPVANEIAAHVAQMQAVNTFGKLAKLAGSTNDPLGVLVAAANHGGLPVTFVGYVTDLPIVKGEPLPEVPASTGVPATIVLANPARNHQQVHYVLNDQYRYSMQAGTQQSLKTPYIVSFDSGAGGKTKRYSLTNGTYEFVITENRWDLQRVTFSIVIENPAKGSEFHYVVNNTLFVLQPGASRDHTGDTALEIAFDRGNDSAPTRKLLKSGRYTVGIDAENRRLDLYDATTVEVTGELVASASVDPRSASATTGATASDSRGSTRGTREETLPRTPQRNPDLEQLIESLRQIQSPATAPLPSDRPGVNPPVPNKI